MTDLSSKFIQVSFPVPHVALVQLSRYVHNIMTLITFDEYLNRAPVNAFTEE